ncbi:MAG TPA: alpha/beta hydrolase fold domain-containing protein [Polyangiaceae bacterium]|nr:alpha/beta hydrolase fold domain-containing protein [Polyangiaceae bacterium]
MIRLPRRHVGLGLLSLILPHCTTRSVLPTSESSTEAPSEHAHPAGKLKILCLHGYHGSARILRTQMAPLAAGLESLADFVFVDAPSIAAGDFGWWHAVNDERDPPRDDPGVDGPRRHYKGWARTRDAIIALFAAQGPFDGVFGFSQGAALTGLLVGLRAPDGRPTPEQPLVFDFAMMVGSFPSNDPELARLYTRRDSYALPSLHLFGRSDGVVPAEDSLALASHFASPTLVEHDGGHVIASDARVRDRVRTFLEERLRARNIRPDAARAAGTIEVPLWAGRAAPAMRVVFPSGGASEGARAGVPVPAMIVFRGGAYATSMGSGAGAAEWAAENGMVGVEVPYRTQATGDAYPKNYADAARAMRMVRARAAEWGIDPARVGVLGFSAGGHLASLLSTQPTLYVDPDDDLATRVQARPDFVILGYPVISFVEGYSPGAFASSAENFFGRRDLDEDLRKRFSNELHVTADHPPVFIWTTADDALVPASHSRRFAEACERAGVHVTFELFPHGPHGMGLALDRPGAVGKWTSQALDWCRRIPSK